MRRYSAPYSSRTTCPKSLETLEDSTSTRLGGIFTRQALLTAPRRALTLFPKVSARPHPFNSHANDLVRDFILDRVGEIASRHPHVTIDYDVVSNASWASGLFIAEPRAVYQEGNNILVKVQGTDPAYRDSGGYLLSAHYDSVSTAPGTTDDSMGIVTLLQMVEHFANHIPARTVVFNFNNNEESGLNGAHTYVPGYDSRHGIHILEKVSYNTRGPTSAMFSSISKVLLLEGGTFHFSDASIHR